MPFSKQLSILFDRRYSAGSSPVLAALTIKLLDLYELAILLPWASAEFQSALENFLKLPVANK